MNRNSMWLPLVISLVVFVIAFGMDWYASRTVHLGHYVDRVEKELHHMESEATAVFEDRAFIRRTLFPVKALSSTQQERDQVRLEELAQKQYTLFVYEGDSLVFWTNNNAIPPKTDIGPHNYGRQSHLRRLRNGYYELLQQSFLEKGKGTYTLAALIPIKYQYDLHSRYLQNKFVSEKLVPSEIKITRQVTPHPLVNSFRQTIAFLDAEPGIQDAHWKRNLLILYLTAFLFLALFLNRLAYQLRPPSRPWLGAAILLLGIFGVRALSIVFDWSERFEDLPLFAHTFDTPLSRSLGDLLINIIILLWMMVFFHRQPRPRRLNQLSPTKQLIVSGIGYGTILMAIIWMASVFKSLVFHTQLTFDFDNVFNLDRYSLSAIGGIILLLISLFLFGYRTVQVIQRTDLNRHQRGMTIVAATVLMAPVTYAMNLFLPTPYLLLIGFVFLLLFDMFVDQMKASFNWMVVWLILLSAFPAILLFKYNAYRDRLVRISYAKELANPRDSIAEHAIQLFQKELEGDDFIREQLAKPFPFKLDREILEKQVDFSYSKDNYLLNNYEYKIYAFDQYDDAALAEQEIHFGLIKDKLSLSNPIGPYGLRFWPDSENPSYFINLGRNLRTYEEDDTPNRLVLEFKHVSKSKSKAYTELLIGQPYKNLWGLDNYDYAIYKDDIAVFQQGNIYGRKLNIAQIPSLGDFSEFHLGSRSEIVYNDPNGNVVVIGREKEPFIKAISLFSYIFTILIVIITLTMVVNSWLKMLPPSLSFSMSNWRSLKNKIQYSVISLILFSFLLIGMVTVWFFRTSSEDYHEKRLQRKTLSVLLNAIHEVELEAAKEDKVVDLESMVKPLSRIHRMDVNLYNEYGNLISSSEDDIYNKGIISRKMPPLAYRALHLFGEPEYINESERVGDLLYKAAYVPLKLKTEQGDKTLAYLGLPYYSKRSNLRNDVTLFMSTLLNVYVFLMLIAGGIAVVVANSITRPLAQIGEKLKEFKLGVRNEKITWNNNDEVGALVNEYNALTQKLSDSADRLAQSEREGAWREMAKQVAHEIKNPLTPMKLSIQYLQHAYKSNPKDVEPLLKRVTGTLIEQIDNLATIASEFSNFAKMPKAENQQLLLNHLVQSVFDLFSSEQQAEDLDLYLTLPEEYYFVFADRNHLMRVFNNLIKNAIQAIPDSRRGNVSIHLYRRDNQAIIKVSDNGTGISADKKDRVFVPNFTTKNSGTGLGLAISKNIIESVNGEIFFETQINHGTDFYVKLPLVEVKMPEEVEV